MRPITHHRGLLVAATLVSMVAAGCNDSTGPSTGAAQVTVTTIGVELDTTGYSIAIDGGVAHVIPVNDTLTLAGLTAGSHSVLLAGLASNCVISGAANPRTTNVVAGATVQVAFSVTCVATTGSLTITVGTTGTDLPPDGYLASVDSGAVKVVSANGTVSFSGLRAGRHSVLLTALASNCAIAAATNPQTVNVVAGATAQVVFSVACVATTRRILFASDRSGTPQIYAMNPDGTGTRELTSDSLGGVYPHWSPDGTKFVYASYRSIPDPIFTLGDYALIVKNADGSGARAIAYLNHVFVPVPAWSPDGSRIAFVTNVVGSGTQIFVVNADGTGLRQFANLNVNIGVAWSPDGSKIALSAYGGAKYNIFVLDVNSATLTQLTHTAGGTDLTPAWSPDGTRIAFVSDRDGDDEIYVMNADGSGQVRLTTSAGLDLWPAWSPDGLQIAFDSHRDGNIQIYVMSVDGSGQMPIMRDSWNDMMPSWAR